MSHLHCFSYDVWRSGHSNLEGVRLDDLRYDFFYYDLYFNNCIQHCSFEPSYGSKVKHKIPNKQKIRETCLGMPCVGASYTVIATLGQTQRLPCQQSKSHFSFAHLHQQHVFLLSDLDQTALSVSLSFSLILNLLRTPALSYIHTAHIHNGLHNAHPAPRGPRHQHPPRQRQHRQVRHESRSLINGLPPPDAAGEARQRRKVSWPPTS